MFETYLLDQERKHHVVKLAILSFLITIILGYVNSFLGGNALFLVALVALALAYPLVSYILSMDDEELRKNMSSKNLLRRHSVELSIFWTVFIGIVVGMYVVFQFGWIADYTYHELFVENVSGMATNMDAPMVTILLNNLGVVFFTFILSIISFSGLIFVLSWNASLLAYYLYSIANPSKALLVGLSILPHGLLEMGGYILVGIAGSLVAYKLERRKKFGHDLNKEFFKDFALLLGIGILLVVVGAIIEGL